METKIQTKIQERWVKPSPKIEKAVRESCNVSEDRDIYIRATKEKEKNKDWRYQKLEVKIV